MIYAKLAVIAAELESVGKDLSVGVKTSSYKAVSEGAILSAVKPLEEKHGVFSYPCSREIVSQEVIRSQVDGKERLTFFERIRTVYRFVDLDDGSSCDVVSFGDGIDAGDKSVGKAMTYSDKYALMKAYKIETGDDPDKQESVPIYTKAQPIDPAPAIVPKMSGNDPASDKQKNYLRGLLARKNMNEAYIYNTLKKGVDELTVHEAGQMIEVVGKCSPVVASRKEETYDDEDDLPF